MDCVACCVRTRCGGVDCRWTVGRVVCAPGVVE